MSKLLLLLVLMTPVFAASNPTSLQFPLDHGQHEQATQESWNFFGHMMDANKHLFGFSLTFTKLSAPYQKPPSQWITEAEYVSNFSIMDSDNDQFIYKNKINRTSFQFAGASDSQMHVWNRGWQVVMNDKYSTLKAATKDFMLFLQLKPMKDPILFGQNGLLVNQNIYFYAYPKLQGHGILRLGVNEYQITDLVADMDHSYQIAKFNDRLLDKVIINLSTGDDIFLYIFSSQNDNSVDKDSFGVISRADGTNKFLSFDDFQFEQTESWHSQHSNVTYPSSFVVTILAYHYRIEIKPTMKNQEITTLSTVYWGGQSIVTGTENGKPIQGYAYVAFSKQNSREYLF